MIQTPIEWLEKEIESISIQVFDGFLTFSEFMEHREYLFNKAKELEKTQSFPKVNRVEVIQHSNPYNGRAYANYDSKDVEIQLQDQDKTLKIFLK